MNQQADNTTDQFEREVDCPTCEDEPIKLRAWASLDGVDRMEVESIAQLSGADVRLLAQYCEGSIEGACGPCAPGQLAHERLAALGGAAPGMPEVPRGRLADNSGVAGFRYNCTEKGGKTGSPRLRPVTALR